jgi:hypothetical protein
MRIAVGTPSAAIEDDRQRLIFGDRHEVEALSFDRFQGYIRYPFSDHERLYFRGRNRNRCT